MVNGQRLSRTVLARAFVVLAGSSVAMESPGAASRDGASVLHASLASTGSDVARPGAGPLVRAQARHSRGAGHKQ